MEHWSPRFAELAQQYGSARVYKIGLEICGWPPTIDRTAGRTNFIDYKEFETIKRRLENE